MVWKQLGEWVRAWAKINTVMAGKCSLGLHYASSTHLAPFAAMAPENKKGEKGRMIIMIESDIS